MKLPKLLSVNLKKYKNMRYGENPHQSSAYYIADSEPGYKQLGGIELSHNNLGDANHAWRLVLEFDEPTVAIIKHGNPSGIASRGNITEAYRLAYEADSVSAFGGIIAVNRALTLEMVEETKSVFYELIVCPDFSKEVVSALAKKSKRLRVVKAQKPPRQLEFTRVFNGYLVQTPDDITEPESRWKVVVGKRPSRGQYEDLEFAWKVVKHVRSNAIVVVRDKVMVGMGTGQPNRVNSVKLALDQAFGTERSRSAFGTERSRSAFGTERSRSAFGSEYSRTAKEKARGAVLASDAFFPFPDNIELAAKAGISVIIQPGGSINDEKVIAAAKKHKMTMLFTGIRHFKH